MYGKVITGQGIKDIRVAHKHESVLLFSKSNKLCFTFFDPGKTFFDIENKQFSG